MRRVVTACPAVAFVCALATSFACGRPAQEPQIQKGADQMQKGAEDMARGLTDMAKSLSAMAGGDPNQKPVDPVSFKDLQTVLPDVAGWQKGKPTGERMTSPVNYAEAAV